MWIHQEIWKMSVVLALVIMWTFYLLKTTDATKKDDDKKVKENCLSRNIVPSDTSSAIITNGAASDTVPHPPSKERAVAFKMSVHEYLELDDDDDDDCSAPSTSSTSVHVFALSNGGSSAHTFSFGSPATTTTPSQPAFSNSIFGFPTAPSGNNDQTSMEDSMAEEDTVHASAPTFPWFGQHPVSAPHSAPNVFGQHPVSTPQSPFVFGSNIGFQFQSQPNLANSQTPSIFQASSSLGLSTGWGGSESNFSLDSGGGDKSNRRFIKSNRSKNRKK